MVIKTVVVGPLEANCYVVVPGETADALVIDPGADPGRILEAVRTGTLNVTHIVDTHAHVDHAGANLALKAALGPDVLLCIHREDAGALKDATLNLSGFLGIEVEAAEPDLLLDDGSRIEVAGTGFEVIHTPGHTPGGICLLAGEHLFTGDTLFAGGVGRVDLPGGSGEKLAGSIREKILSLDGDIRIYPGHGPTSTVDRERRTNPFLL